jgi:hypothetical protein
MTNENETCELDPISAEWFQTSAAGPASQNACRVRSGNSCGSGTLVGHYQGGSLVLTNAHVVGSRVGTSATCQFNISGGDITKNARIIMAAYSERVTADWAIVLIENWQPLRPVFCTRQRPTSQDRFYTTGSPRCVWPLRHQSGLQLVSNNNAGFAVWNQPAIGGQSGSGVFNMQTNLTQLLLTWRTGNNQGAGQPLDFIYAQAKTAIQTGTLIGGALPRDIEMLSPVNEYCEEGFFAEASIRNLPIWFEDQQPTPPPPVDPPTDPTDPSEPWKWPISKVELTLYLRKIKDDAETMLNKIERASDDLPINPPSNGSTFGL